MKSQCVFPVFGHLLTPLEFKSVRPVVVCIDQGVEEGGCDGTEGGSGGVSLRRK